MHGSVPIPPDPESERRGHELRDVALKPILIFLVGLFIFGGVLQGVMSLIMSGYVVPDTKVGVPKVEIEDFRKDQQKMLSADGSRDDSASNTFKIHREHRGVKTRPRPEGPGYTVSNKPVGDISIELHDAHGGNDSDRDMAASAHIVDQVLGGECGRLIQRMPEDRRCRIFRHAPDPSRRRVRLEIIFIPLMR